VDEAYKPVALELEKGGRNDRYACTHIIGDIPKGATIVADKGYDCKRLRRRWRGRGYKVVIPKRQFKTKPKVRCPKPAIYLKRWGIERTFAHFEKFKRLLIRFEYHVHHYLTLWEIAACELLYP
jgi:transposase